MYGSENATGILINLKGQMIGMIDVENKKEDIKNIISAYGITELKKVGQNLSNGRDIAYMGIYGSDVTMEANEELGVPYGAYITKIDMDSPAMDAGIQSGDIIVMMEDLVVNSYKEFVSLLTEKQPEDVINIRLLRQGPEGYSEMDLEVTLESKK